MASETDAMTAAVIERFHVALNSHDPDAVVALLTEDSVFESTAPPDGERFVGRSAVRGALKEFLQPDSPARFEIEELIVAGNRAVVCWSYRWGPAAGQYVRGVDVMRVRDGRVAESLAYVKG